MRANKLKLNGNGTEIVLITSQFNRRKVYTEKTKINDIEISPASSAGNPMDKHVHNVYSALYYQRLEHCFHSWDINHFRWSLSFENL